MLCQLNISHRYKSLNFDLRKKKISFLIFHYTETENLAKAIKLLTGKKRKVSCHYIIDKNGEIYNLVDEKKRAWHAGESMWKRSKDINSRSIGIEIVYPGEVLRKKYRKEQIESLIKLSLSLKKKYKICNQNILGHSDIAPYRKKDPGEKFPWRYLSKYKVGLWHGLNEKKLSKMRAVKVDKYDENDFLKNLNKIGYLRYLSKDNNKNSKLLTKAFQRRFRQNLINGVIDKECLLITKNLTKNLK